MEGGTLHKLRIKWWKQKRGGGACQSGGGGGGVSPLGLSSVAGVFLVTMLGCGIATVFAIIEFLYGTRQAANEAGVSWVEEMTHELKFIFQCHGNTKEVRAILKNNPHNSVILSYATRVQTQTATRVETASHHILVWTSLHHIQGKKLPLQEMDQSTRIILEW